MEKFIILPMAVVILVALTGCDNYHGTQYYKTYIFGVEYADSVRFETNKNTIITRFVSRQMNQQMIDEFCKNYGDLNYNRNDTPNPTREVIANRFSSIEIVSDCDYNSFKAGESLKSITKLVAASPYIYIQSGYKKTFNWEETDYPEALCGLGTWQLHPVINTLDKLSTEDLKLLNPLSGLQFTEMPDIKEHNFTITFIEGENQIHNAVHMIFEE